MKWIQSPPQTKLGPSPSDEFHGCLDALIVTIRDMRYLARSLGGDFDGAFVDRLIESAEERAANCAGLLFDRWIEETEEGDARCTACLGMRLTHPLRKECDTRGCPAVQHPQAREPRGACPRCCEPVTEQGCACSDSCKPSRPHHYF